MKPHDRRKRSTRRRTRWPGFSLAELMIALAVLGMGLLVIGAALPAGVRFTKESADISLGRAAGEYALDVIEQRVCLRDGICDFSASVPTVNRAPVLFQPRYRPRIGDVDGDGLPDGGKVVAEEPIIKVRPLFTQNVHASRGVSTYAQEYDESDIVEVCVEQAIENWLSSNFSSLTLDDWPREVDRAQWRHPPLLAPEHALRAAIPSAELFYPPISADAPWEPSDFFASLYAPRPVASPNHVVRPGSETRKALERRVSWVAFDRRASWAEGSDPALYEFVVLSVGLPSENHRFAVQDPSQARFAGLGYSKRGGSKNRNSMYMLNGDCGAPVPWLVTFQSLPPMRLNMEYIEFEASSIRERGLDDNFRPPAQLVFTARADVGVLLPSGSVFIPAVNDRAPSLLGGAQYAGFVPSAPDVLPIYEVIERHYDSSSDTYEIAVKNNGYYPWVSTGATGPQAWPVWVVPPAFAEMNGASGPVFEDKSPVLTVTRRYVRLERVP